MKLNKKDFEKHSSIVKTQNRMRKVNAFLFLVIVTMSIILVYNFNLDLGSNDLNNILESKESLRPHCDNKTFEDTAICLNNFARINFKYNITRDDIVQNIDEMIERGGDCKDYVDYYEKHMEYYGFNNSQRVRMFVDKEGIINNYHVFLTISHYSGYCTIDINNLECYKYINDDGEAKQ